MNVFISSLITNFEQIRNAVKTAIVTLRHDPIMAEDFGAQPNSPQVACLQGLRRSDVVVLVLGEHYGSKQAGSGLSATHEEYRDAKGNKPVIAFVQEGVVPDAEQAAFITEVQGWEGGLFRGGFREATDLQMGVTRALHDYDLTKAVGSVDTQALIERACAFLPKSNRNSGSGSTSLGVAVVGGPFQAILRPVELEAPQLANDLKQAALFGPTQLFDLAKGTEDEIDHATLVIKQDQGTRIQLDEQGAVLIRLSLDRTSRRGSNGFAGGFPALIEETVQQHIDKALIYAEWVLERIDATQRLTHVAVAARIDGNDYLTWRTQREHDASPDSGSMGMSGSQDRTPVHVSRTRAALRLDRTHLVEDLLVPLRRQWKARQ